MAKPHPKGPFKLMTVNNAPERAKRLIGRVTEDLSDRYTINYVGNCLAPEEVEAKAKELQPDIMFCASMWTPEQSIAMSEVARAINPNIKVHAIPHGLQVKEGPDAVVNYLKENIPLLLE